MARVSWCLEMESVLVSKEQNVERSTSLSIQMFTSKITYGPFLWLICFLHL